MSHPITDEGPNSLMPPILALAAIGLAYGWASWSTREVELRDRTRRRLA